MFIEYQLYPGVQDPELGELDFASVITNLKNDGNNLIVGFIQPSKKLWYQHLHDWCHTFLKNPPVFLMISNEHQVNFDWPIYFSCLASLGLLTDSDDKNCDKENEKKVEENQKSCGCRLQVPSITCNCFPNIIYIPPSQPQGSVDWIKRLVEPECLVFDDCANHTHNYE